jgi:hypothetical protein
MALVDRRQHYDGMNTPVLGVLRPTPAYYFPLIFFAWGVAMNTYGLLVFRGQPTALIAVAGLLLSVTLLTVYLRYARTVELTPTALLWRGPYREGQILVAHLTGVRFSRWSQAVILSAPDTRDLRLIPSRGSADLVAALSRLRPDLLVQGHLSGSLWVNVSPHTFRPFRQSGP